MPPHSRGMCGAQRPAAFACSRSSAYPRRQCPSRRMRSSAGITSCSMKARTRRRTASTSPGSVKSIATVVSSAVALEVVVGEAEEPLRDRLATRHPVVLRLSLVPAVVELLHDDGHLEDTEDVVVRTVGHV